MMAGHKSNRLEEIGRAMSRASGTAKAAGISFEMLGAYIATVSETTRQEAGSIGTALNAIMTRLTQVKQKGYNEEDETKVNDVAKALARLGIQLVDANGEWRDMEDIFQEIGAQWAYLDDKTQNYLATVMAGIRQQNTFRIIMEDLSKMNDMLGDGSRIMELYSGAMDSAGTAAQKMSTWQESYESSQQNLLAEWEEFVSHIDITSFLKEVNNGLAELLGLVNNALNPQANLTPYKQAEEQIKRITDLRNYAGNGSDSLMFRVADIFGYNQGGLNETEAEDAFSEIVRLGEIAKKMASDRGGILGAMDVAKGMAGYGISSYVDQDVLMELVKYFAPDGTWDDAVYDAWVEWCAGLGTHMRNAVTETEFGDVSKEMASSLAVLFEDAVKNLNDYAGTDFDGQALMNTMLTNMLGKNWTVKDLDENVTGLVNDGIQAFYDAFNNIWQSVSDIQFGNNMVTGDVAKYVEKDVRDQIDAFNKLYGTNLSYEALAETINPLDPDSPLAQEQAALRETEEAAKALQAQIEELFTKIDGSYGRAAEIKRQQDLGFKDWLDSFYEQLRDADNVETETEFTDVLNSYLEGKVKDPEFYKALEKEYTQLGELQEALKANDGTKAFLLFQEMMADYTEKTTKAMTDEEKAAQKQQEKLDAWIESRKTAAQTKELTESGFASWIEQIRAFGEAENGSGLYDWFISQDEKLRDSFLAMYPPLDDFMTLLLTNKGNIGWMKGAWEGLNNLKGAIPTADETKKLDAFLKTVQKSDQKAKVEEAKKNKFVVERGQLMSFFSAGRSDIISQLQGYMNGNVDLTLRPVIDSSELKKAGWDEEGGGIATLFSETFANQAGTIGFTATPILPNGKVLTQKEFYDYIDQLMTFSNASEMIKFDKENKGLLINWLGIPDGADIDEFLNEYAKVGEVLHNLHEQLYAGDSRSEFDQAGLLNQLMIWQEDGTLAALYSSIEGLEPLISKIILDGQDGFINDSESLQQLQELLFSTTSAWDQYVKAKTKAFNDSVSSDAEGAALLTRVSAAIDTGTLGELWVSLTEDEQEFIESTVDGFDKYIAGAEDATEVTKELGSEIGSLNLSQGITDGTALASSDSWYKDAISGSKDYYASLAKADSTARELAEGWETLALLQSDVKLSTKELTAAYEILASATDLSKEQLAGPGGLQLAEQSLATSTSQVSGTVEILLGEIQRMTGMNFSTGPLRAQLDALRASADAPTLRVLDLIDALLKLNGMESRATVIVDQVGGLSLSGGGGWFDAAKGGLSKAWSGVKNALQNYKNKSTAVQSRASGGGGGGGGSKSETDNLKSEIEKMIHMMDEVQKIWDHHFDMLEAVRNDFEQDKLLQGVMLYYQKESDAIAENNKTLEENLKQIEALLPKQQALVSSMSTTDEEYEKASADLEKLQSAHQKYSKQLVENQTKIKEYAEKIKETRDKIRDMEIDLRNTILKAIQDREALEKSMRDARISMENEVYDAIKRRYEKERDLILDNAKTRKDALNEEKSLLDENLNKRKEAQEQQEKQAQLLQLQQKLVRISADPTRQAERLSIQKQIKDLQDELAWSEAEDEVEAQKESIDNQIKNLDDYMEYVTAYYDDIFEHPKQLLAEVEQIMNMTDTEILDWMKANSEEWDQSSASSQAKMLEGWTTTLREMHGQLELYWDEVEYIISQGDDYIIEFLKQNSAEYREAGKLQAEAYVDQWREQLEDLRLAHQSVVDDMQQYAYSTIRLSESSGSSSSGGGGGGGGGNSGGSTKTKLDYLDPAKVDVIEKVGDGIMSGLSNALTGLANAFSGKTTVGRTTGNGILNLGSSEFSPGSTSSNKLYNQAMVNMRNTTASGVAKGSITSGVTLSKSTSASTPKVSISSIGSGVKKLFGFASGGEMDETGFAILHGKPGRPERVLDPVSTELFNTLVADLHEIKRIPVNFGTFSAPNIDTTGTGNTMFGDINISVETLSSDEDYEEIADRIMEVINERMGRGRAVGGIRRSR